MARTFSGGSPTSRATPSRVKCGFCEPVHTVAASARTSASAQAGPMLAWDWKGHSYSASITRAAFRNAASRSPSLTGVSLRSGVAARMWSWSCSIGGNALWPSVQPTFSSRAARTASHSRSATTARNSRSRTTRAPGIDRIDPSSTAAIVAPAFGGRIMRACSMRGSRTSVTKSAVPNTLPPTSRRGADWPTTLYADGGLGRAGPFTSMKFPTCPFHSTRALKCFPPIKAA